MIKVRSTGDVSLTMLEEVFAAPAQGELAIIDPYQLHYRSVEPPSWVEVLLTAEGWLKLLAGGVSLYVAGALAEAGKDSWRARTRIIDAAKAGGTKITALARQLVTLQNLVAKNTRIQAGLPVRGDERYEAFLRIDCRSTDDVELQLVSLALHVPGLQALFSRDDFDPCGWVILDLSEGGGLDVRWQDSQTLAQRHETLVLE